VIEVRETVVILYVIMHLMYFSFHFLHQVGCSGVTSVHC